MKRKFSLGMLQPLKIGSSKSDSKPSQPQQPTPPPPPSRVAVDSDYSPITTPIAGRRPPLPTQTEAELRLACASILRNLIPSHLYVEDHRNCEPPQLDYATIKQAKDQDTDATSSKSKSRSMYTQPAGVPDTNARQELINPNRYAYKPDAALKDLFPDLDSTPRFVQANLGRPRDPLPPTDVDAAPRASHGRPHSLSMPAPLNIQHSDTTARPKPGPRAASHDTSGSTPRTDNTDYPWHTSTAATSVATPGRASMSKRGSAQNQSDSEREYAVVPDPAAVEWMKKTLETRRQQQEAQELETRRQQQEALELDKPIIQSRHDSHFATYNVPEPPASVANTRPPSRARSITRHFREYIRPGAGTGLSRTASREPSRPGSRAESTHSNRSTRSSFSEYLLSRRPSVNGWRSWSRPWKDSADAGDDSRPTSSRGRSDTRDEGRGKRKSVNLNRELPPLPGLDQWKPEPEKPKHIANLWSSSKTMGRKDKAKAEKSKSEKAKVSSNAPAQIKTQPPPPRIASPEPKTTFMSSSSASRDASRAKLKATSGFKTPAADSVLEDGSYTASGLVPGNIVDATHLIHHNSGFESSRATIFDTSTHKTRSSGGTFESYTGRPSVSRPQSTEPHSSRKRRPSKLDLDGAGSAHTSSPSLYKRSVDSSNGSTLFQRHQTESEAEFTRVYEAKKHRHMSEISSLSTPPPVPPKDAAKPWWNFKSSKSKKPASWIDQMEKLDIRGGVMVDDESAASPVIRF